MLNKELLIKEIKGMRNEVYQARGYVGDLAVGYMYEDFLGVKNTIPTNATIEQIEGLYEAMVNFISDHRI